MFNFFKALFFMCLTLSSLLLAEELEEKSSWGVEINPASVTILGTGSDTKIFSGEVSYFNQVDATELALSFVYAKDTDISASSYYDDSYVVDDSSYVYRDFSSKAANLAFHYRKFLGNRTKWFYYGGFASYTYLDGKLKNDNRLATVTKVGLGAEVGLRIMKTDTDWSLYWGPALRIGGYLGSNNDIFDNNNNNLGFEVYDRQLFVDIDFMRIGFRF